MVPQMGWWQCVRLKILFGIPTTGARGRRGRLLPAFKQDLGMSLNDPVWNDVG
jgi:hypothetical protein